MTYFVLFPRRTFITVSTPGGGGLRLSQAGLSIKPPPQTYSTNGLAHVKSYVSRLQTSGKKRSSVIISTLDGQHSMLLIRDAGQTFLSISADRTRQDGQERRITAFFGRLGMITVADRLSSYRNIPDGLHTWHFALPEDGEAVSQLCISIFTDLFEVSDQSGLRFSTNGL